MKRRLEAARQLRQRQANEALELVPKPCAVRQLLLDGHGSAAVNLVNQTTQVIDYYRGFKRRIDFAESWPPRGANPKWHKLKLSLARWLPKLGLPRERRDIFLEHILLYIRASWAKR